jgi:hypothetical protein
MSKGGRVFVAIGQEGAGLNLPSKGEGSFFNPLF